MLLNEFARNRDGGVAPMLALAALPLFASVCVGVDFGPAAAARTMMQAAVDVSALALAKEAQNVGGEVLLANAENYFYANFQNPEVKSLSTTAAASSASDGYTVDMSASGKIATRF